MPDFSGWTGYQTMDGNTNCRAWADWQTTRVFRNGQAGWDVRIILKANKTTSLPTYGTGNTQVGAHQTNSSVDTKYMTIVQSETTFRDETLFVPAEAGADIPLAAYANIHIPNVVSKGIKFTVTAKRNLWGVYFDANGGSGAPSMMKRHWGEIVYIPYTKPTRPGYTFKGWTKSKGSSTLHYSPGDPIGDDFDVTLYAIWGQNVTRTWSITYNANGGYNAPAKQTANVGQSITITYSKPTRSGYTFLGWSTWSGATEPESAYTPGYSYMSEYDTTLYAVWKQNQVTQYSLSFNLQGGTGAFNTLYGGYGERVQIPYTTPTKSGYTFKGWSTSSTGSPQYQPGDYYTIYRNTILYAIWSESTQYCTITFNANGGSGAPSSQQKIIGEQTYIPYTKPTRSGYTFLGWSTSSWATSADYQPGSVYTPYGNMTFYAVWKQNVVRTWSIIYDANGGYNTPEKQTANVGQSITITSSKPTRNGYTFLGWSTWSEATEPEIAFTPGYSYKSDYNFTLYAVWKEKGKPKFTFSKSYDCIPYGIGAVEELVMNATVENPENLKIYYKICFVDDADGTVNDYATNSNGLTNMIETGIASANLTVQPDILIQSIKNCNNEQSFKIVICSNYDNNFDISNTAINKEIVSIRLYYNKPVIQSLDVSHAPHNSAQLVGVVKLSDNFINTSFRGNGESVYIDNKLMELGEDYGDDNRFDVDGVNTLRYVFNFNVNKISDVSHIFKLAVDDGFFKTEQTVNLGRLSSDENIYIYQDGTIEANGFLLLNNLIFGNEDVILFNPGGFVTAKSFKKISEGVYFCPKVLEAFGHTQRTGG